MRGVDSPLPQGTAGTIEDRCYWDLDFPDRGQEEPPGNAKQLTDQLEHALLTAVSRRPTTAEEAIARAHGRIDVLARDWNPRLARYFLAVGDGFVEITGDRVAKALQELSQS